MLNLVVLDVLDHSGQLHSRLSEELWHRHSGYPVVLQGGAAVMVEITFPLLVLVLSALHHYYRHHPISQPLFHYPSASLDYTTSRTERARLLLVEVELLLWTNPREFTRSRRYPKYRRNNPPFRFNLLHFARIPRRIVMTTTVATRIKDNTVHNVIRKGASERTS